MYASLINPFEEHHRILNNQKSNDRPNYQVMDVLLRHSLETRGSEHPPLYHRITRHGQHEFHVTFYDGLVGDDINPRTFDGKNWR